MLVPNFMTTHPIVIEILHLKPQCQRYGGIRGKVWESSVQNVVPIYLTDDEIPH